MVGGMDSVARAASGTVAGTSAAAAKLLRRESEQATAAKDAEAQRQLAASNASAAERSQTHQPRKDVEMCDVDDDDDYLTELVKITRGQNPDHQGKSDESLRTEIAAYLKRTGTKRQRMQRG